MSSQLLLPLGDTAPVTLVFLTSHVKFYSLIKMLPKNHSSCGGLCKRVVPSQTGWNGGVHGPFRVFCPCSLREEAQSKRLNLMVCLLSWN